MDKHHFDIIDNKELFLKRGETSSEVVIEDKNGENLFLTFKLNYISKTDKGHTHWRVIDEHHGVFEIDTRPNSVTQPSELIEIGTTEDGKPIFIGFLVQAQIPQTGQHQVTITIYTKQQVAHSKQEVCHGA